MPTTKEAVFAEIAHETAESLNKAHFDGFILIAFDSNDENHAITTNITDPLEVISILTYGIQYTIERG